MKRIITGFLFMFSILVMNSQNQKATLYFNDGSVKQGLASIENTTYKTIKFRKGKRKKITYYNYEHLESIHIQRKKPNGTYYEATYEYRKFANKKKPKLVQLYKGNIVGTVFIKLKNGSNLTGSISTYSLSRRTIKFTSNKGEKRKILFDEIEKLSVVYEQKISDYYYIYFKKGKKPILMELLVKGELSLYKLNAQFTSQGTGLPTAINTYYVIKKNEEIATEIINSKGYYQYGKKNFKKKAIKYFNDCPVLQKKLETKEFRIKDIKKVIEFYNNDCGK